MGDNKVVEAKSQEIVVGQLDIWKNKSQEIVVAQLDIWKNKSKDIVVGQLDICQNKSTHLMDKERQILVKGEKMPTLNYSILK